MTKKTSKTFWQQRGYKVTPTAIQDIDLDYEEEQKAIKEGVWVMSMRYDEAKRLIDEMVALDKAEAQLLGWKHAKNGGDLFSLVSAMGLTMFEWQQIKSVYEINYLSEEDVREIDNFFCEKVCDLCKGVKVFDGQHCPCTGKTGTKGLL